MPIATFIGYEISKKSKDPAAKGVQHFMAVYSTLVTKEKRHEKAFKSIPKPRKKLCTACLCQP